MHRDAAIEVGQDALIWLAGEPEALEHFLALTGADAGALRAQTSDPAFLGSVLDYVLGSDATVTAFAAARGIAPEAPAAARAALPGGDAPSWT